MYRIQKPEEIPPTGRPVVLAMGCFDGVHIGHQKVIATAVEQAASLGGEAWVYTFNPHPAKVLVPDKAPELISAPPCRMRQFEKLGVCGIVEIPFDRAFAQIEPEDFLSNLWRGIPSLRGIVCGIDWSFGRRAGGNFQTLEKFCNAHGLTATAVQPVLYHGEKVSSTHIRKAVQTGHIPLAEKMLGRPFSLFGKVIPGNKIGRELGFPTANIDPMNELLPAPGVYAARTWVGETVFDSAVFVGKRETFGCHKHVIESYLIDFEGDLYDQPLEICLVEKTRDVHPFPSRDALIEQIKEDLVQVADILKKYAKS